MQNDKCRLVAVLSVVSFLLLLGSCSSSHHSSVESTVAVGSDPVLEVSVVNSDSNLGQDSLVDDAKNEGQTQVLQAPPPSQLFGEPREVEHEKHDLPSEVVPGNTDSLVTVSSQLPSKKISENVSDPSTPREVLDSNNVQENSEVKDANQSIPSSQKETVNTAHEDSNVPSATQSKNPTSAPIQDSISKVDVSNINTQTLNEAPLLTQEKNPYMQVNPGNVNFTALSLAPSLSDQLGSNHYYANGAWDLWTSQGMPKITFAYNLSSNLEDDQFRDEVCDRVREGNDVLQKKSCVESTVMDEAVKLMQDTLKERVCERDSVGACLQRSEYLAITQHEAQGRTVYPVEIHLGLTTEAKSLFQNNPEFQALSSDGYLIKFNVSSRGNQRLFIFGKNSYATLFGVSSFLREWLGARWVLPGSGVKFAQADPQKMLALDAQKLRISTNSSSGEPHFKGRILSGVGDHPNWGGAEEIAKYRRWLLANRIRPDFHLYYIDRAMGKKPLLLSEQNIDTSHRMTEYIDPAVYGNKNDRANYHPEWYSSMRWYPLPGNNRVSIQNYSQRSGRTIPADLPQSCNPANASCIWIRDGDRFALQLLNTDNALEMFRGASALVPYDVVSDAEGLRRFIPGVLPENFSVPSNLSAHDLNNRLRLIYWDQLVPGDSIYWKACTHERDQNASRVKQSLITHVATKVNQRFASNPQVEAVSVAPSDGGGFCQCEFCRAKDGEHLYGTNQFEFDVSHDDRASSQYTRRIIEYTNAIAARVPDKQIVTYAYTNYLALPPDEDLRSNGLAHTGPLELLPNVRLILVFPLDEAEYDISYQQRAAGPLRNNEERWVQKGQAREFGIYDYPYGVGYMGPHVYLNRLANGLRHAHAQGARIYVGESYPSFVYDDLQLYVLMQLLWDSNQSLDTLKSDFINLAYGRSSNSMATLYQVLETGWARHPNRWNNFKGQGLKRFENVENQEGHVGPGGFPYGWNDSRQFCVYNHSDLEQMNASVNQAQNEVCSNPQSMACQKISAMKPLFQLMSELNDLAKAKSMSALGDTLKSSTVRNLVTLKTQEANRYNLGYKVLHPAWAYYAEGLIGQLDAKLSQIKSGQPVQKSLCEE